MLSTTLLALFLALTPSPGAPPCAVCDCAHTPVAEAVEGADAVFIGRVQELHPAAGRGSAARSSATLLVQEELKGGLPSSVRVVTPTSTCGYPFEVGQRYLVYAERGTGMGRSGRLGTNRCMRTSLLATVSREELAYLRARE